jgi:hypothetical protein
MPILRSLCRLFQQLTGGVPIIVKHVRSDGPEWFASIPGTKMHGAGWTDEAAIGNLIRNHRFELGFKIPEAESTIPKPRDAASHHSTSDRVEILKLLQKLEPSIKRIRCEYDDDGSLSTIYCYKELELP